MGMLFKPARAVMYRLKYPQKFLLISLLFSIPLGVTVVLLFATSNRQTAATEQARVGATYLRVLHHLLQDAIDDRLSTYFYYSSMGARAEDAQRTGTQLEADLHNLATLDAQVGSQLQTTARVTALQKAWQDIRTQTPRLNAQASSVLRAHFITDVQALIAQVGDTSALILDPELLTFKMAHLCLERLPAEADQLAEIQLLGARAVHLQALTAEDRTRLIVLSGQISTAVANNVAELTALVPGAAAPELTGSLTPAVVAYRAAISRYLKTVAERILDPGTIDFPLAEYQALATQARQVNAALWEQLVTVVDLRLAARATTLATQQGVVLAVVLASGLLVTYLLIGFYQSVMTTVRALSEVALRMGRYDVPAHIELETQDELAQVVQSFNTVAGALLGALTEQQQAVTHLRAAAARLSSAAEEQQHVTTGTSVIVAQVLDSFETLDVAARAIAEAGQQVAEQATTLQTQHQAGETAVATTQTLLTQLQQTAHGLEEGAHALLTDAHAASLLSEEITAVADTTHLLSLNATLEAAGAGPYGRRFSVIAAEVRALAETAAQAADQSEATLARMTTQSETAAGTALQARRALECSSAQLQILSQLLATLLAATVGLTVQAQHIRTRTSEQRGHSQQVQQSTIQMAQAMQQLTGASQQVAAQAHDLLDLASMLDRTPLPRVAA